MLLLLLHVGWEKEEECRGWLRPGIRGARREGTTTAESAARGLKVGEAPVEEPAHAAFAEDLGADVRRLRQVGAA